MKKIFSILFTILLFLTFLSSFVSANAAAFECDVDVVSSAVYMENLQTGTVVFEKSAEEKMYPASLTKVMTYIVVCENIPDVENTKIVVKEEAFDGLDPESSVMGLQSHIGESFTVLDLLYGMMVPSGNDAAWALADYVGDGSVDNFVDLMNRKAGQLGCEGTHFVNPHGLYDDMHYSTASDMAAILKYAAEKPHFMEIASTREYDVSGMDEPILTTNYMIDPSYPQYYYSYIQAGKTGYTDEAGKCLATTAKKDDYSYLLVALGAPYSYAEDVNYAMLDSKNLYEWAFSDISFVELLSSSDVVRDLAVRYVWGDERLDIIPKTAVSALLPNDYDESLVTTKVDLPYYVSAPVKKDEVIGTISVYYDDELVGSTELITSKDIERDELNYLCHQIIDFISENPFLVIIIALLFILILSMIVSSHINKKRRQRRRRYR